MLVFGIEGAEAGAGAMLVACRLAGLSALEAYYAGVRARVQCRRTVGGRGAVEAEFPLRRRGPSTTGDPDLAVLAPPRASP